MTQPYYIVPIVERYQAINEDSQEAQELAMLIAVNIGDKETLEKILWPEHLNRLLVNAPCGSKESENAKTSINDEEATPSSTDTIDSFLNKFGTGLPTTGYLAQVKFDTPQNENPKEEVQTILKEKEADNKEISELKKLINNKQFAEALMLIERQNLNNPQKSIYFALQMRFIKKLMAIENYKNKPQG